MTTAQAVDIDDYANSALVSSNNVEYDDDNQYALDEAVKDAEEEMIAEDKAGRYLHQNSIPWLTSKYSHCLNTLADTCEALNELKRPFFVFNADICSRAGNPCASMHSAANVLLAQENHCC